MALIPFSLTPSQGFQFAFQRGGGIILGGGQREGNGGHICGKNPKMALISDYLAAALSPDVSADALDIINIGILLLVQAYHMSGW